MASLPKPRFNVSIAVKYAVSITLLIVMGMGIVALVTFRDQSDVHEKLQLEFGRIISQQIASSAVEPFFTEDEFKLGVLLNNLSSNSRVAGVVILNHDFHVVAHTGIEIPQAAIVESIKTNKHVEPFAGQDHQPHQNIVIYVSPIVFKGVTGGYAALAVNNQSVATLLSKSLKTFITVSAILCISVSLLGIAMAQKFSQPITSLAAATRDLQQGKLKHIPERRSDELGMLISAINNMSHGLIQKDQVEAMLNKLVDRDIAEKVLGGIQEVEVGGEHVEATVLFADIVGFTNISETLSPQEVSNLLNEYYGYFDQCAKFYFGTVDKFIGDAVMLVFGAPKADKDHQFHALACAVLMNRLVRRLNKVRKEKGLFEVNLRIGINSGSMLAGLIGGANRMQYTVVGDAVNLASRLCSEAGSSQIIIEESMYNIITQTHTIRAESRKQIKVRGKSEPVAIYHVHDIEQPNTQIVDNLIDDIISQPYKRSQPNPITLDTTLMGEPPAHGKVH
ncbi:MAG: adenylate/guanylate cyclase domain-containing protein [Pseudomonadota bacterium]|nr:adenylate/guanylate cyclase domain-containing protein [Pseudomonadota bacterium]